LTSQQTDIRQARFPAEAPPTRRTVEALEALENWRNAATATAVVTAVALPLALSAHTAYGVATVSAVIVGWLLAVMAHLVRECRLRTLVIHSEFAQVPSVARKRRRLVSSRSRRALARCLHETAATTQPPTRFDSCPVLRDRVADVRAELCDLGSALERHPDPDPACVALIRELLSDGASPLYNPNVPASDLQVALARVRVGLLPTDEDDGDEHRD
jgi:hypothetical protein